MLLTFQKDEFITLSQSTLVTGKSRQDGYWDSSLWKWRHRGKGSVHNCWKDSLMTASVFCGASSLVTSLGCITMTQRARCILCSTDTKLSKPRRSSKSSHQLERFLATIFWDMEGIIHIEFMEQGTTIDSEIYVSTLPALKGRLRRVRQDKVKDVVIQHDNARPHTSRQTQCALQQLELPTIPHPPYSPDLAPSDFFLFPLLKKHLKGNHYKTDAEVEVDVRSWCRSQTPEFFADRMRKLVQRGRLCIDSDSDYVEKW